MNRFNALKEKKTLLIDDDVFVRDSLRIVFATNGCFMRTEESAEAGLCALKRAFETQKSVWDGISDESFEKGLV